MKSFTDYLLSTEYLPAPVKAITKNAKKYTNANSFLPKGSLPCTTKAATAIVIIVGMAAKRVLNPRMISMGQMASPITVRIKETVLPSPIGSPNSKFP